MLYTSGTTGRPKGVLFTNRNLLTIASMISIELTINVDSRMLHIMPLSHSAPLHLFLVSGTYVGSTHVLAPTFTPDLMLDLISGEKITHFFGAPVAYMVFKTDRLMCLYGSTEAGPNGTLLRPEEHDAKAGSVGQRAALHCEVQLVDEDGDPVKQGDIGEIILRGEGTMKGYYKNEEKTNETIKDGWLYTGDMGIQDEDGYFWVIDRKKDIIISGGVNVFPKEIEETLTTHPAIAEAAVIGVPHPEWGETVKVFVVLEDEVTDLEENCKRFLKDKLASYKIPRIYTKLDALPRNASGKLLKQQLRELQKA